MIKLPLTGLAAAVVGLALSSTVVAGVASADPDLGPLVNTTCSYPQVMAALNAQNPAAAAEFNSSPVAQAYLNQFLASPPSQRLAMAQELASDSDAQELGLIQQIAVICNKY
jgi:hemophore-related protein